ncbi:MAG: glycosyltransferase, partial [Verrucomicrobia bacterium]|nr:glycosyltransferase [Verrucomicrobiota bacterium]
LTIHNLEHQGVFTHEDFLESGLPLKYWAMDGFEHHGRLNLLKGGIQHADKISTVSPTYAKEIRTVENGQNLEECLRFRGADLVGILNGIDEEAWDPLTDASIPHPISPSAPSMGKKKCKESILKEFKLSFPNKPLLGVVSRLYEQKGLDLLLSALPEILKSTDATFIILGSGAEDQENGFLDMAKTYPEKIAVKIGFDDALARRIFAGSDFFLMPSRFEPCGLAQQYAMRYGSVPIARKTGGLADTIRPRTDESKDHTGYLFDKADKISLAHAIKQACDDWRSEEFYSEMQTRTMQISCSWELAAQKYAQLYNWISAKD